MGSSGLGKAATLDELLRTCIEMFDDNGELNDTYLPRIVLLMHRWYLPSTELAEKLLCMYRNARGQSCDEFRLKICYFMRYWILKFPAEFNLDLGLIRMTEEFRDVASQLGYEKHVSLMDISSVPSYDWMRRVTQRKKVSKKGKACLLFDHLEPIELAEHLTFLEHKSFRRISVRNSPGILPRVTRTVPTFPRAVCSCSQVLAASAAGLCWKRALDSQEQSLLTKYKYYPVFSLWLRGYISVTMFNVSFHRIKA